MVKISHKRGLKFITIMRASQKAAALIFKRKKLLHDSRMSFCGATNVTI